jgi:site-specific recombinase XerD
MQKTRNENETSELIERFLRYKLVIQGRSVKTVCEYHLDLRLFFRYLIAKKQGVDTDSENFDKIDISCVDGEFSAGITTLDILEFMAYLLGDRKCAAAARSRKLSAIKTYFKYLTSVEKIIEKNPASDIESPKIRKALPKYLSLSESKALLESVGEDENTKTKERDYCILTFFLNCGMRLSELVGINLSDIDREVRSLRVVGKGNKERIIYLNDACRAALSDYVPVRARDSQIKDKNALFISRFHKRISIKTVQWLVYKYLGEAGLENKHYSTHKLRHTAATLMYQEGGVDVLALKEILGHEQLNTTQIYTHVSNNSLEEAVESNPLAEVRRKK